MEKTLRLNLKAKWYDMIESGYKKEEYREIKPYWSKRLLKNFPVTWRFMLGIAMDIGDYTPFEGKIMHPEYDTITFVYGYTKRTMKFKLTEFVIGTGKEEWGAEPGKNYFVIKIGDRIE